MERSGSALHDVARVKREGLIVSQSAQQKLTIGEGRWLH